MASSSITSSLDDRLNNSLIFKRISDLDKLLSEVKHYVSSLDNDNNNRLHAHVDASCVQLIRIKETFTKLIKLEDHVCSSLVHFHTHVDDIFEKIKKSSNPAAQTLFHSLTSDITNLYGLLPSVEEVPEAVSQAKQRSNIENPADPSGKSLALFNPLQDQSSFNAENFSELIKTLDSRSRQFLFFFSVFPPDAVVNKRVLKNWWIGEGLLGSSFVKAENMANEILEELMAKCFIEAVRDQSRLVGFKLRPYIYPLVIRLASFHGFFAFDDKGYPSIELSSSCRACLVKAGGHSSIDVLRKAQDVENLETLFNINEQYPDFKPEFFSKLKNIKVLCLGKWQRDDNHDIERWKYKVVKVKNLQNNYHHVEVESIEFLKGLKKTRSLRLLSLHGISRIIELPESLCMQVDLRILDLNSCYDLEDLPKDIGHFKKLTYLDLSGCYLLDRMPKGMAELTELRVLKGFLVVNLDYSCSFLELNGLKKLRKLSLYTNRDDFPTLEELSVFGDFKELRNLSIIWGKRIKGHKRTDDSKMQEDTAEIPVEGLVWGQVNSTNEVGGTSNTTDANDGKKKDAGAAFKLANQRTQEDVLEERVDLVALDKGKKTINVEAIEEECVASETTMGQQNADGRECRGDIIVEEETAGPINTGSVLKQEADTCGSTTTKLFGEEAKKDVGSKTSAIPRKTSTIKRLRRVLEKLPTIKQEKEDKPMSSQEIFKSLEKLDIQCYPLEKAPEWLKANNMNNLKRLYIRGGKLKDWFTTQCSEGWKVEILRLKFLQYLTLDWGYLQACFPELIVVEKVDCPNIKSFPKYQDGFWLPQMESTGSHQ